MKQFLVAISFFAFFGVDLKAAIYDEDDRFEAHQVISEPDNEHLELLSRATAAMIHKSFLVKRSPAGGGTYYELQIDRAETFKTKKEKLTIDGKEVLVPWSKDERFSDQPLVSSCTGFLISSDLLLTAGHCVIDEKTRNDYYWVFDYAIDGKTNRVRTQYAEDQVYESAKFREVEDTVGVIGKKDLAVVELKRNVKDRKLPELRLDDTLPSKDDELTMVGYPYGLPQKISRNGRFIGKDGEILVRTEIDSGPGYSGAPVFNASPNKSIVEAIHNSSPISKFYNADIGFMETSKVKHGTRSNFDTRISAVKTILSDTFAGKQLLDALAKSDWDAVDKLLEKGASTQERDAQGRSALHFFMKEGRLDFAQKIIKEKSRSSLTLFDKEGKTPLHYAAESDYLKGAEWLLDKDYHGGLTHQINVQDKKGYTAYFLAKEKGSLKVAQLLSERGANKDLLPSLELRKIKDLSLGRNLCIIDAFDHARCWQAGMINPKMGDPGKFDGDLTNTFGKVRRVIATAVHTCVIKKDSDKVECISSEGEVFKLPEPFADKKVVEISSTHNAICASFSEDPKNPNARTQTECFFKRKIIDDEKFLNGRSGLQLIPSSIFVSNALYGMRMDGSFFLTKIDPQRETIDTPTTPFAHLSRKEWYGRVEGVFPYKQKNDPDVKNDLRKGHSDWPIINLRIPTTVDGTYLYTRSMDEGCVIERAPVGKTGGKLTCRNGTRGEFEGWSQPDTGYVHITKKFMVACAIDANMKQECEFTQHLDKDTGRPSSIDGRWIRINMPERATYTAIQNHTGTSIKQACSITPGGQLQCWGYDFKTFQGFGSRDLLPAEFRED